jgi:hypothetical protein
MTDQTTPPTAYCGRPNDHDRHQWLTRRRLAEDGSGFLVAQERQLRVCAGGPVHEGGRELASTIAGWGGGPR